MVGVGLYRVVLSYIVEIIELHCGKYCITWWIVVSYMVDSVGLHGGVLCYMVDIVELYCGECWIILGRGEC